jgi:hypothetical protein
MLSVSVRKTHKPEEGFGCLKMSPYLKTNFLSSVYTRLTFQSKSREGMSEAIALFTMLEIVMGKPLTPTVVVAFT